MRLLWSVFIQCGWILGIILSISFNYASLAGTQTEIRDFGTNPGQLRMFHYVPDHMRDPAPLVVLLHGCKQTALVFAEATGWIQYADRWGFALLMPQQQSVNNSFLCFNWFRPEDATRDQGEALSIRQMIARSQSDLKIDPRKIYVTGLSAGGAMTAVLLATYPEIFAGGATLAGIPYGCASGLFSALWCQWFGRDWTPAEWGEVVREASADAGLSGSYHPRISIWQGESDWVVNPDNAQELLEQWTQVLDIDQIPDLEETVKGYPHRVYKDAHGTSWVETYTIPGMGHGAPIALGKTKDACGQVIDYILPVGICASYYISQFWGLDTP